MMTMTLPDCGLLANTGMVMGFWDWTIVAAYFLISLLIGLAVSGRSGSSSKEYFSAGSDMPWWLLGISIVATTFSTEVPNLVTDMVRTHGVAGNWMWWSFLLTGMTTVFIYAGLWRRSGVMTDIEFYELRYGGSQAAFLRGFRALYLGILFNGFIMASTTLAAIKFCHLLLGLDPVTTVVVAAGITVVYSAIGGLMGVLVTDFFMFFVSMAGSVGAACIALQHPAVGGLSKLVQHEAVQRAMPMFPEFTLSESLLTIFLVPLLISWWSVWYPGAEPGGGGYVAQRMLAAKNENHAVGAVLLFNFAHYAIRPWPWIIVALCSIVVFPTLDSLKEAFPSAGRLIGNDMGYPAMLTFLPPGMLGLVAASLIAAYMSTISTHLNWGASYIVHDFYQRFVRPQATEKELVWLGRVSTAGLMLLSGLLAIVMQSALDNFAIILQIGAGTGLLFLLRWFWWRINAACEISAMIISFLVALYFRFGHVYTGLPILKDWQQLVCGVALTTLGWGIVMFLTKPTDINVLRNFCKVVRPGGPGWTKITDQFHDELAALQPAPWPVPTGIACSTVGCVAIYSFLFATGYFLYGQYIHGGICSGLTLCSSLLLYRLWNRMQLMTLPHSDSALRASEVGSRTATVELAGQERL